MNFTWLDVLVWLVVISISYWVAFVSSASEYFVKPVKKRERGAITRGIYEKSSFIKKFDILVIYRGNCVESSKLANKFVESCALKCELCEADDYDFEVLEYLNIPIVFILDTSERFQEFISKKETDPKDVQAYKRRYLNNLRYAVISIGDGIFSEFIDTELSVLGAKRLCTRLIKINEMKKWTENLIKSIKND